MASLRAVCARIMLTEVLCPYTGAAHTQLLPMQRYELLVSRLGMCDLERTLGPGEVNDLCAFLCAGPETGGHGWSPSTTGGTLRPRALVVRP